ncbi:MAG TPA: putative maltokinase [Nitrospira sp.]|nr:putative maltokinase [Nitrospira sp.]
MLTASQDWLHLFERETVECLIRMLPSVLRTRRWFGGKGRRIEATRMVESIAIPSGSTTTMLLLIQVEYGDGGVETYTLPVTAAFGVEAERIQQDFPQAVIAPVAVQRNDREETGLLYDALWNRDAALALLQAISQESQFKGTAGSLNASSTNAFADLISAGTLPEPAVMKAEQSNTSVAYDNHVILKLYRRLERGINPDLEIGRVLTRMQFPYTPPIAGALEYHRGTGEPVTLALLQQFVSNDGDAWRYSLEAVNQFVVRIIGEHLRDEPPPQTGCPPLELARQEYSPVARQLIGPYLESAERLGRQTAELHMALSQVVDDPAFAPEPFTKEYRQARYDYMVRRTAETLRLLEERIGTLSPVGQAMARRLFELKPALERTFHAFKALESSIPRIRCHGDYHLGQVLCTGADFMIIDFEGEPARSLAERRMKQPAMVDVAGMARSFHYAPFAFLEGKRTGIVTASQENLRHSALWASFWSDWANAAFLKGYFNIATGARFWPRDDGDIRLLFDAFLVEKAMYELGYELNNRPDWAEIPLHGLVEILEVKE